jgi:rubrerythrin
MNNIDTLLVEAMNAETKAKEFYENAAQKAQSQAGKRLFNELASFERNHFERVKQIIDTRKQNIELGQPTNKQDIPTVKPEIQGQIEPNKNEIVEVINLAIKAEKDAQDRYRTIAQAFDEPKAKEIFNDLAEEEYKHQRILEDQFYHMSNKGTIIWE